MLTQLEAEVLIKMRKTFASNPGGISVPPGTDQSYDLIGEDTRERFLLDLWRGTIRLSKLKFQARGRKVIVLVRLDIDGSPHTNPDGQKLVGSHMHIYQEGFEDKWAYPVDPEIFKNPSSLRQSFEDFCRYCNINAPVFQDNLL